jgi:hypothetical protein
MKVLRLQVLLLVAIALMWTATRAPAQAGPKLAAYFTELRATAIDPGFASTSFFRGADTADLNGDGNQDLVALGFNVPGGAVINTPQPGRVLLGDGDGHFTLASPDQFPVDSMLTVHPRKVIFADFNADQRPDMFVSTHGWDAPPFPGEQNRLYLSRAEGGWRDATGDLPQLNDFSHSSAVGDVSGRGLMDIFVGNSGGSGIPPYFLLNTGSGQFVRTASNIPAGNNQVLDFRSQHHFVGATLDDLNDDGLPELMIGADAGNASFRLRRSFILWNRSGVFVEGDRTELPSPAPFPNNHIDHDIQRMDVNQDGLQDLLVVGRQTLPLGGWFVQILINRGGRQFVDETAERMPLEESFGGVAGAPSSLPWAEWVRPLDFNQDGALDFYVIFNGGGGPAFPRNHPLIWINDGTGHFSTWKLEDFVPASKESLIGSRPLLMATRNGYSFINVFKSPLDPQSRHFFAGATLDDLNDDGWPDLIVAASSPSNRLRRSFILWNRSGVFVDGDRTELPSPAPFPNNHIDHDIQRMDVNQDGLQDLLVVGRQTIPLGGWFVQILINRGSRQFVDETAERMPQEESFGGIAGAPGSAHIAYWVRALDFNQDGALDFYVIFQRDGGFFPRNHPLIWINDGTGHFSTWKLEDFVTANKENLIGGRPFLVATRNGYSFITLNKLPAGSGLTVRGLLVAKSKLPGVGR